MDLTELAPAPWSVLYDAASGSWWIGHPNGGPMLLCEDDKDPACVAAMYFAALVRNAFAGNPEALAWWEANRVKQHEAKPSGQNGGTNP